MINLESIFLKTHQNSSKHEIKNCFILTTKFGKFYELTC